MTVDPVGRLQLGEMIKSLSQDLFGYVFIIGLVFIEVEVEGHWQEKAVLKELLMAGCHIKEEEWRHARFEYFEEGFFGIWGTWWGGACVLE